MPKRAAPPTDSSTPAWYEKLYAGGMSDEYKHYMASEWAFEKRGDRPLFEKLCLESAQTGLSWATILAKREGYRAAFHGFDIAKCAAMSSADVSRLLSSERANIVRNAAKVNAVINNAQCVLDLIAEAEAAGTPTPEYGHFDAFLWSFVDGVPQLNEWADTKSMPSTSATGDALAKALKARGFKFVGPTTCYSLMQSCGLVIDHPKGAPEWEAARARLAGRRGGKGGTTNAKRAKRR